MDEAVTIEYGTGARIALPPGRALRLAGREYPLFRTPEPAKVAAPDECLTFLRELHLSHCGVFDVALRRWVERYFDAVRDVIDSRRTELAAPAGLDPETAHLAWCYAAYRPLPNARFARDGASQSVPALFWLDDGPLAVRFEAAPADGLRAIVIDPARLGDAAGFAEAMAPVLDGFWQGVAAPRHPFARAPLSGLSSLAR